MPSKVKDEVGKYAHRCGTQATTADFRGKYQQYTLNCTTVNNWKRKFSNPKEEVVEPPEKFNKKGRPSLVGEELLVKLKEAIIEGIITGAAISRKMVISIGNGMLKANDPNSLSEFGGRIMLTINWARGVLKSMDWVKRKGTTGKVAPSAQFLAEENCAFQRAISTVVYNHDIPADLSINLDQTPLSYVSPGKYTFNFKVAKNILMKSVDDKHQITATFAISATGEILPVLLIYPCETKRCLPDFQFPLTFQISY